MNRVGIKVNGEKELDFFLIDKEKAEKQKIIHLTIFNMILLNERKTFLFRVSKVCDFKDFWSFVAGHIENMKEVKDPTLTVVRETKEEIGLKLDKRDLYVIGKEGFIPANNYKMRIEDLISEEEISKSFGLNLNIPHMVLPFFCKIKDFQEIKLSDEFDKYKIIDMSELKDYKLTPITRIMKERFIRIKLSDIL